MSYIVRQPDKTGRIRLLIATNHHDPIKKQSRQERVYLGVLDKVTNELLLGANSAEPGPDILKLLEAKGIKYCGRKADLPGPKQKYINPKKTKKNFIDEKSVQECRITNGKADVFYHLKEPKELLKILGEVFGEKIGNQLFALAVHQACDEGAMYLAADWIEEVGIESPLSSATISRLMKDIGTKPASVDDFFKKWIITCGKPTALIHDTTSISSYSENSNLFEWGYNRDGEDLPQVNLALVVARDSRLPLWYRIVPGSIPDVSTLKITCNMLKKLGLDSFSFSLDRGYYSNSNLSEMLEQGLDFTIGVPISNNAQAKVLVQKNRPALDTIEHSFLYNDYLLRHIEDKFSIAHRDGNSTDLPAHLYFEPGRKEQIAKRIETAVLQLKEKASKLCFNDQADAQTWISDNTGKLKKYFSVSNNTGKWEITRDCSSLTNSMIEYGLTLIVTSKSDNDRDSTLADYRCRDIAEKVFDTYKNGADFNRLRSGNSDCIHGRLFIAFLAVTLRSAIESKLRDADLLKTFSVSEALNHLSKIKRVHFQNGKSYQLEVPKKVRTIANALGLPVEIADKKTNHKKIVKND